MTKQRVYITAFILLLTAIISLSSNVNTVFAADSGPSSDSTAAAASFATVANIGSENGKTEICYDGRDVGMEITGIVPQWEDASSTWAGVLHVTVDGEQKQAFCADLHNERSHDCLQSTVSASEPLVACTLEFYPPELGLTPVEAAARQATVWRFTDEFSLEGPSEVKALYDQYVADILAKAEAGQCDALLAPVLTIDPPHAVNFLTDDGDGGYLDSPHDYTVQLKKGSVPVANHPVSITTDLGVLSSGAQSGSTISAVTDDNGEVKVTVSHNAPGTATLVANAVITLPSGLRFDIAPNVQKLVIGGTDKFSLDATATKLWEPGGKIAVRKFHDVDRNGVYNTPPDSLIDWNVKYRQQDGSDFSGGGWTELALGEDGTEAIVVELGKTYQVCEIEQADWVATTPTCFANVLAGSTVSFGNVQLPALLIVKYHDLNGNGVRDAGEPSLEGWQFKVSRLESNVWSSSYGGQTDASGKFAVSNIVYPFQYRASETMQSGWYSSTAATQEVLIDEPKVYTLTFGNLQPGSLIMSKRWFVGDDVVAGEIAATLCLQRNADAPANAPVPTINGQPLTLTDGKYCAPVQDSVTVDNVWPGAYTVTEVSIPNWVADAVSQEVDIVSGNTTTVTFNNHQGVLSTLGNRVWIDENENGEQDEGEPDVPGIKVTLYTCDDEQVGEPDFTDENGEYLFIDLLPGCYYVVFDPTTLPEGFTFTTPNTDGAGDVLDSDADPTTGKTPSITLGASEDYRDLDAGLVALPPDPTNLPIGEQPQQEEQIFLPTLHQ